MKHPNADAVRITEEARRRNGHAPGGIIGDVTGEGTPPVLTPGERHALTDLGNADRFVARYGTRVLWCEGMRAYLVWDGKRWAKDDGGGAVVKLAQEVARAIHREAADETDTDAQRRISRWAVQSQNAARVNAALAMARPHLAVSIDALDSDPWLLNCQNGTLDLRTGALRPHGPQDLITKIVPVAYDPAAKAPRFEKFLREVLVDEAVIGFAQRFAGYSLTGDTRERAMTILWGSGKNGKSTLVELLLGLLGDYADSTDVETVLAKKHSGVGNDVAALRGHRLVSCSEVEKGRRLAESKVKQLTGRDTITARFLFCEPFSFRPEFKLWMSTNNKPEIVGTDDAIWDRIKLVPFTQRFEGKAEDPRLPGKLQDELSGVLAWAVRGCLEWQRDGLGEPDKVKDATKEYRAEMDTLAAFIDECCVVLPQVSVQATRLYEAYKDWCARTGEDAEKQKRFGMRLGERGFKREKSGVYHWLGIGLSHNGPDDSGGDKPNEPDPRQNGPDEPDLLSDGPSEKSSVFAGETQKGSDGPGPFGPKSISKDLKNTREKIVVEKGPEGPEGPEGLPGEAPEDTNPKPAVDPKPERLTEDQVRKVQRLMSEGMDPKIARREVLGEGA